MKFGGSGAVNPRVKISRKKEWDEREYSIKVKIPPLGISIYQYTKAVEKLETNRTAKRKRKPAVRAKSLKEELQEKYEKEGK